jgi:hypothetical protein
MSNTRRSPLRKTDLLILTCCAILVLIGLLIVHTWLNQALGYKAVEEFPLLSEIEPIQDEEAIKPLPMQSIGKTMITMEPKATYRIHGQLVGKKRYRSGFMSSVSPYDYALIWGDLPKMTDRIKFRQVIRYCLYSFKHGTDIDVAYVQEHMSNNHLIPANKNLRKAMSKAKKGDLICIDGYLVDVYASKDGQHSSSWRTSMQRDDIGDGACEIIYVTSLRINDMIYN